MKRSIGLLLGTALSGLLVMGCNNESTGPEESAPVGVTNEATAMKYYAENDSFVSNDEVTFADKAVEPVNYGSFGKIEETIVPLRFGRFIKSINKQVDLQVQEGDTIAIAHVVKTVNGELKIRGLKGQDTVTVTKPFSDASERYIIFKRVNRERVRYWMNWVPVGSSMIAGGTVAPNNQVTISKIETMLPGGKTLTVAEPMKHFFRYRWLKLFMGGNGDAPELMAGENVTMKVTVVSASPDTDIVTLRYGFDPTHGRRVRMQVTSEVNNGDGTFTRTYELTWQAHFHRGFFNAHVDAMTKGTLYDDVAPYSVSWWAVPYRVY